MATLLHELILEQASRRPDAAAIVHRQAVLDYAGLARQVQAAARGLLALGLKRSERVAIYLPKQFEAVVALFAAASAGGVFVPINPLLKPEQVGHILRDCDVKILVTARARADRLNLDPAVFPDLRALVLVDQPDSPAEPDSLPIARWQDVLTGSGQTPARVIDLDMAAILYTSGSTGKPKGVVLSHRNLLAGAYSVASYLANRPDDRLLAVLPFSFDYGLSQLTTAFVAGARAVLMDYLLARDVVTAVARERITGLAAVPPMWVQLAQLDWPREAIESLRYFTNSGGAMPRATLDALRRRLPKTTPYLMYGLTEAFRSTYLPPEEIDRRPDSIGKAIPNAEILVVREDGSPCAPGEPGELVHRGSLVAQGYWNDPEKTAERFRPLPGQNPALPLVELAVWSGDTVRADDEGFLYFIGRKDDMIKTSGYRVSPTEIEEVLYDSGQVAEAAAIGVPHWGLGQAVVGVVKPLWDAFDEAQLINHCKLRLPNFMVPLQIVLRRADLPRNPNGKIDRKLLAGELGELFSEGEA
ncbi:MAG: acyl-CoA ligase (AMP-forming), exosortase A system-associated [Candidatus Competibacteraceae bacterium]|nr:acyl-CoA ligase (AMP-forming), exosortase A system-associated [Candidatus Competibacteraceae bacterium]